MFQYPTSKKIIYLKSEHADMEIPNTKPYCTDHTLRVYIPRPAQLCQKPRPQGQEKWRQSQNCSLCFPKETKQNFYFNNNNYYNSIITVILLSLLLSLLLTLFLSLSRQHYNPTFSNTEMYLFENADMVALMCARSAAFLALRRSFEIYLICVDRKHLTYCSKHL